MLQKKQIVGKIITYLVEVIEQRREEFSGLAACPYAKAERVSGDLLIDVYDPSYTTFAQAVKDMEDDGYQSGLWALFEDDQPVEIEAEYTKKLQNLFNKSLDKNNITGYQTICINPNDTYSIGEFNPRGQAPYFLVNITKKDVFNKAHTNIMQTKYFQNFPDYYKKFLKL